MSTSCPRVRGHAPCALPLPPALDAVLLALVLAIASPVTVAAPLASPTATASPARAPVLPAPLTLEVALATALARNPGLGVARVEVEASDGAIRQAGARPNPTVDVEQEDAGRSTRSTTLMLSQPFELGGKRAARVELAQRDRDLALGQLDTRLAQLRAATTEAFFDGLIAQDRIVVATEAIRIAGDAAGAAQRRADAGKVSPIEAIRARVAEATARIDLTQARSELATALQALAAVMAVTPASLSTLAGSGAAPPPSPADAELERRLQASPLLKTARGQIHRAEAAYDLERARRLPDISVSIGATRAEEVGRNQLVLGFSVPLPFFDRNEGGRYEALRRVEASRLQADADETRLRAEVNQAAGQLRAAGIEAGALEAEVLPAARTAWEAARRGYELGKFGFLDVIDAQRTWLEARTRHLDALARAHRARAELDRRLGETSADVTPGQSSAIPSSILPGLSATGGLPSLPHLPSRVQP